MAGNLGERTDALAAAALESDQGSPKRGQAGSIEFDRSNPKIPGSVTVLAGSGKTGNDSRDKRMNKDFLKADQFTNVSFAPKTYTGTIASSGDATIPVSGVFTLLSTTHDLTIPMQINLDGSKATAKAHFVVPYVQWGLKNPSFMFWKAENDVQLISISSARFPID